MVKDSSPTGVSASLEDYLEAIYWLAQENHVARSRDIAERLAVSKSSVTGALRQLNADGFVNYDPYSYITLTEEGERLAQNVVRRHSVLRDFLHRVLGLTDQHADEQACKIEHTIDEAVLERLELFMDFVNNSPADLKAWLRTREEERGA